MKKILISYGTRPEYIKIKPIIEKLSKDKYSLLFTGQHKDIVKKESDLLISISDGTNRLDSIICSILNNESIFENIDYVMVMGDTTSALAVAMAAFHRSIPVIHLEAGLRTFDMSNPYPEEFNRRTISCISSINFCPTENNMENLKKEKCQGKNYVVGNTSIDNLIGITPSYGNSIIITLHRRENHHLIHSYFERINLLAEKHHELKFICPIHPNPNVYNYRHLLTKVQTTQPLCHQKFLNQLTNCKFVISDSGGIQEEASFLNKKVIVCRKVTERQESVNKTSFICQSPEELNHIFEFVNNNYLTNEKCPFGDGFASERIVKILNTL